MHRSQPTCPWRSEAATVFDDSQLEAVVASCNFACNTGTRHRAVSSFVAHEAEGHRPIAASSHVLFQEVFHLLENSREIWIPDYIFKKRRMQASVRPKLSAPGVVYGTAINYGSHSADHPWENLPNRGIHNLAVELVTLGHLLASVPGQRLM